MRTIHLALLFAALPLQAAPAPAASSRTIDPLASVSAWKPAPAAGVDLKLARGKGPSGDGALRLEFDFGGKGGWAAARRRVDLSLAGDWAIAFSLRGGALPNDLEVKLVDASGDNVWWVKKRDVEFPVAWARRRLRRRQFEFAWGPAGGGEPKEIAYLEFAVTAGSGGKGWIELADLKLETAPEPAGPPPAPVAAATSEAPGHAAAAAVDGDPATSWQAAGPGEATLTVDLGRVRDLGGLVLDWGQTFPARYTVELSPDGTRFDPVRMVTDGNGGRDHLMLPEAEARAIRVRMAAGTAPRGGTAGFELRELAVMPPAYGASPNAFFAEVAKDAPRGSFPRAFSGEQSYFTVAGVEGAREEALLSEDGAVEPGRASFSVEPFLLVDGRLVTWADVTVTQALAQGDLPVPSVTWSSGELSLTVTLVAHGTAERSAAAVRYRVANRGARARNVRLFLAVRPFQVNPPWQFLGVPGGATPVRSLDWDGRRLRVGTDRYLLPVPSPESFGAATFDAGDVTEALRGGTPPPPASVSDPFGYASGAFAWELALAGGSGRDVVVSLGLGAGVEAPPVDDFDALQARVEATWREAVDRVKLTLPPEAERIGRVLRSTVAYVLVNRDGPSIQPGSRSYEKSWIRDGSLTSEALLRLGHEAEARAFLDWFWGFVGPDGRVPCCADRRGADPVPENDSHGQLLFLTGEVVRYTGDVELAARLFPKVESVVAYLDALRKSRRTDAYRTPERRPFFGLLPESISHEGYSAKPMHSYWDDFFAARGLDDAVWLALLLGRGEAAGRFAEIRDELLADLKASIRLVMERHAIPYVPGCAELGDFDATSTTAALSPGNLDGTVVPLSALLRTYERYWENVQKRERGEGDSYTPYEHRAVGALLRLGWRERALALLDLLLRDLRPAAWNQWAEVVWRDPRTPKFIGDMPHTWVGTDFVRSALDLFAYEAGGGRTLVIGAGVPERWARSGDGVAIRGLRTPFGRLDASWSAAGSGVKVRVEAGLRVPVEGFAVRSPLERTSHATVGGAGVPVTDDGDVQVTSLPVEVVFWP